MWPGHPVHLMSSYSPNLPIPTFPWSACRVHLMSSLLGLPNSIQQFKCHTTLHMLSVLCVVLVYNFLGKLHYFLIKVSWKFLIAQKQFCGQPSSRLVFSRTSRLRERRAFGCKCHIGKIISKKISFIGQIQEKIHWWCWKNLNNL